MAKHGGTGTTGQTVTGLVYAEPDSYGNYHSWYGEIACPKCGLSKQRISHCKDVNGTWVNCANCGLVDIV